MGVEIINCPSCGEETFNKKFCIFCGKNIEAMTNQAINEVPKNGEDVNRFDVSALQEKLKTVLDLKNKFEEELDDLNSLFTEFKKETEKGLADFEKDKGDAEKKLDELTVLYKLEELQETDYKEQTEALAQRIRQDEENIKSARSGLKELKKINNEIRRLNAKKRTKSSRKKRIKEKLADLELAYKNKKIGSQLYTRLKTKYENQLKK